MALYSCGLYRASRDAADFEAEQLTSADRDAEGHLRGVELTDGRVLMFGPEVPQQERAHLFIGTVFIGTLFIGTIFIGAKVPQQERAHLGAGARGVDGADDALRELRREL